MITELKKKSKSRNMLQDTSWMLTKMSLTLKIC